MLKRMMLGIGLTLVLIGTLTLAFETLQTKPVMGNTWYVPTDFATIQEAIYNETVVDGDIIEVHPRATPYNETVVVNKTLTIRRWSEATLGDYPIIEAPIHGHGTVFNVTSPNVNINGFIIRNGKHGIYLSNQSATILNNTITSNDYGVCLSQSYNNTLKENRMTENFWNFGVEGNEISDFIQDIDVSNEIDEKPIYYLMNQHDKVIPPDAGYVGIVNCVNITVEGLDITHNREGVLIVNSTGVAVKDVSITSNEYGIWALMMDDSNITNAEVSNNDWGLRLGNSSRNIISNNLMLDNGQYAQSTAVIELRFSSYNTVVDNELSSQHNYMNLGIVLYNSSNNTIVGNTIKMHYHGIHLYSSSGNIFYHNNVIDNRWAQVVLYASPDNRWDNGCEGNYWSDYEGDDDNGDGIGDTPYIISNSPKGDSCPLMKPWSAWRVFQPPNWAYVETPESLKQNLSTFSNSTLGPLYLSRELHQISLKATSGYSGFLNITIPRRWLDGPFEVEIDGEQIDNVDTIANANHSSLYITFSECNHTITITGTQLGNILGDLDGDGDVDLYDAVALLKNYGYKEDNVPEPYELKQTSP